MTVSVLFILTGSIGVIYHILEIPEPDFSLADLMWVFAIRLLAIACGLLLWNGIRWARWLAVAWLAYHVALGAFHSISGVITHLGLLVLVCMLLYWPSSNVFFTEKVNQKKAAS